MDTNYEGADEISSFRAAIADWARQYAEKHRAAPKPAPTLADAVAELRRWSHEYWSRAIGDSEAAMRRAR
jgi:hypothetical protein